MLSISSSTLHSPAGAARQLMRSAASRGQSEKDMDDFTRDMGGRMVIKVFGDEMRLTQT